MLTKEEMQINAGRFVGMGSSKEKQPNQSSLTSHSRVIKASPS